MRLWPAFADGIYVMVKPLAKGKHTVKFGGTGYSGGDLTQDVTDTCWVK
jgi:hypothetical protein